MMIFRHAAGMKHAIGAIMVVAGTALSGWPLQCIIIINSHINVNSLLLNYKLYSSTCYLPASFLSIVIIRLGSAQFSGSTPECLPERKKRPSSEMKPLRKYLSRFEALEEKKHLQCKGKCKGHLLGMFVGGIFKFPSAQNQPLMFTGWN